MNAPATAPKGYRFLTGLVGGLMILGVTQASLLVLPAEGSIAIRFLLDTGGMILALIAPIQAVIGEDVTYDGAMAAMKTTP